MVFYWLNNGANLVTAVRNKMPTLQQRGEDIIDYPYYMAFFTDRSREDIQFINNNGWVSQIHKEASGYPRNDVTTAFLTGSYGIYFRATQTEFFNVDL